jgi:hypothetical protein
MTTIGEADMAAAQDIVDYIGKQGGTYSQWYVGVAADGAQRLFNDHHVDRNKDAWIYSPCATSSEARAVEQHFLKLGMKGGPGGGDSSTKIVYAYRITNSTRE